LLSRPNTLLVKADYLLDILEVSLGESCLIHWQLTLADLNTPSEVVASPLLDVWCLWFHVDT